MVHAKTERVDEASMGIAEHSDHRALTIATHSLVHRPSPHHGAVVDANDEHLVDPKLLEHVLCRKIAGDLPRGSARRESAGQAHEEHTLAREALLNLDFDWRVAVLDGHLNSTRAP
jgi:hypothetical protein